MSTTSPVLKATDAITALHSTTAIMPGATPSKKVAPASDVTTSATALLDQKYGDISGVANKQDLTAEDMPDEDSEELSEEALLELERIAQEKEKERKLAAKREKA